MPRQIVSRAHDDIIVHLPIDEARQYQCVGPRLQHAHIALLGRIVDVRVAVVQPHPAGAGVARVARHDARLVGRAFFPVQLKRCTIADAQHLVAEVTAASIFHRALSGLAGNLAVVERHVVVGVKAIVDATRKVFGDLTSVRIRRHHVVGFPYIVGNPADRVGLATRSGASGPLICAVQMNREWSGDRSDYPGAGIDAARDHRPLVFDDNIGGVQVDGRIGELENSAFDNVDVAVHVRFRSAGDVAGTAGHDQVGTGVAGSKRVAALIRAGCRGDVRFRRQAPVRLQRSGGKRVAFGNR